jgi:hypothetical protein
MAFKKARQQIWKQATPRSFTISEYRVETRKGTPSAKINSAILGGRWRGRGAVSNALTQGTQSIPHGSASFLRTNAEPAIPNTQGVERKALQKASTIAPTSQECDGDDALLVVSEDCSVRSQFVLTSCSDRRSRPSGGYIKHGEQRVITGVSEQATNLPGIFKFQLFA